MSEVSANLYLILQLLNRNPGKSLTPSFFRTALNLSAPEVHASTDEGMEEGMIAAQALFEGGCEFYLTPSGKDLWRLGEITVKREGFRVPEPPAFIQPRYKLDAFELRHLETWFKAHAPVDPELNEDYLQEMIEYIESLPKVYVEAVLAQGWPLMYGLWESSR